MTASAVANGAHQRARRARLRHRAPARSTSAACALRTRARPRASRMQPDWLAAAAVRARRAGRRARRPRLPRGVAAAGRRRSRTPSCSRSALGGPDTCDTRAHDAARARRAGRDGSDCPARVGALVAALDGGRPRHARPSTAERVVDATAHRSRFDARRRRRRPLLAVRRRRLPRRREPGDPRAAGRRDALHLGLRQRRAALPRARSAPTARRSRCRPSRRTRRTGRSPARSSRSCRGRRCCRTARRSPSVSGISRASRPRTIPDAHTLTLAAAGPRRPASARRGRRATMPRPLGATSSCYLRVWNRGDDTTSPPAIPFAPGTPVTLGTTGLDVTLTGTRVRARRPLDHRRAPGDARRGGAVEFQTGGRAARRPPLSRAARRRSLDAADGGDVAARSARTTAASSSRPLTRRQTCCTYTVGDGRRASANSRRSRTRSTRCRRGGRQGLRAPGQATASR